MGWGGHAAAGLVAERGERKQDRREDGAGRCVQDAERHAAVVAERPLRVENELHRLTETLLSERLVSTSSAAMTAAKPTATSPRGT